MKQTKRQPRLLCSVEFSTKKKNSQNKIHVCFYDNNCVFICYKTNKNSSAIKQNLEDETKIIIKRKEESQMK